MKNKGFDRFNQIFKSGGSTLFIVLFSILITTTIIVVPFAYYAGETIKGFYNPEESSEATGISNLLKVPNIPQIITTIKKDEDNSTRILLVGHGGGEHDGPDLADTVIVANINNDSKVVTMLSLPRDLYIKVENQGIRDKLNKVYERLVRINNEDIEKSLDDFREAIEVVIGKDIHYSAKVNFNGFVEIVDYFDGINITLDKSFYDPAFPNDNLTGYTTFSLPAGTQKLDGKTALKFARSRHSSSDFDRSARQHMILNALREKATSGGNSLGLNDITGLYRILSQNFYTNMSTAEIVYLVATAKNYQILSKVIHDNPLIEGGYLYTPPQEEFDGAFVLLPNNASPALIYNYETIHKYIDNIFNVQEFYLQPVDLTAIYNGTFISGLAGRTKDYLTRNGVFTKSLRNFPDRPSEKSILQISKDDESLAMLIKNIFPEIEVIYSENPLDENSLIIGTDIINELPKFY